MSSLDDLLQQLENQHRPKATPPEPLATIDQNLAELQGQLQEKNQRRSPNLPIPADDPLSNLLQSLEQDSTSKKLKESQQNQQICQAINQVIEAKRQQPKLKPHDLEAIAAVEKQKQQREKYWQTKAKTWLKALDPISNEGMWFTEFADGYESPLDAAIDYLMALE